MKTRRVIALLVALAAAPAVLGLNPAIPVTQYTCRKWTLNEGLPQSSVQAIHQTPDGYLWIGTQEGLARFDGIHFTVYDTVNTPEMSNDHILAMEYTRDGTLWIGTYSGGALAYRNGVFRAYTMADGLPDNIIYAIRQTRNGDLWFGTNGQGLGLLRNGRFQTFTVRNGLPANTVRSLSESDDGTLWVGTDAGLCFFRNNAFHRVSLPGPEPPLVQAVETTSDGGIWVGTAEHGLFRVMKGSTEHWDTAGGLPHNNIQALFEDAKGVLWVGTFGSGICRFRNGAFDVFQTHNGLSENFTRSIGQDAEGNLWIGTQGGGINQLRDGKFLSLSMQEGLSDDIVWSVLEDRDGSIWIGTRSGGLNHFKNGAVTTLRQSSGLASDTVWGMTMSRDGALWIGTGGGGLNRLKDGKLSLYTTRDGLSNNNIRSIIEDRHGTLWIGTEGGGLNVFRDGAFKAYTEADGLAHNQVRCLLEDRDGAIWAGTARGLSRLEGGRIRTWRAAQGLSSEVIMSLYQDADGTLWAGTAGGGLNRVKDGRVFPITSRDGMYDEVVYCILEDRLGWFWMSCNKGIFRVRRQELNDLAEGRIRYITCEHYTDADGMRSRECNGGRQPVGARTRDGRLWFATIRGVVSVDPQHMPINHIPPPVHIETFAVDDVARPIGSALDLGTGPRRFEFTYSAACFTAPEKVRFRYVLEGFDRDWIDAGPRRTAYYTNLPPGRYTFRVQACNNDGIWNNVGARTGFTIPPHFYQTVWFYVGCAVVVVALAWAGYRVRIRQIRKRERELEALVENRTRDLELRTLDLEDRTRDLEVARRQADSARIHAEAASLAKSEFLSNMSHELRTPLNSIIGFSEILQDELYGPLNDKQKEYVDCVTSSGRHLLSLINDILDLSKIESGKMDLQLDRFPLRHTVEASLSLVSERAARHALSLTLNFDLGADDFMIEADERKLKQILFNLLSNAVKFTPDGGAVTVAVSHADGVGPTGSLAPRVRIAVADTGIGISPEDMGKLFTEFTQLESPFTKKFEGTGLGLALSKKLVEIHGGTISAESRFGTGSVFTFEIPVRQENRP
ncbi:MAG: hypothetical protein KA419_07745 [Acidobacteria bacterium]|nr:hypothetical protein [Acidobacteriota bacterium]